MAETKHAVIDFGGGREAGEFQLEIDTEGVWTATFPMSRFEAEELMHQMVFHLGYKLEN